MTYGTAKLHEDGTWHIDCEPHVRMRLRRWLPRAKVTTKGTLTVKSTPEVCRDLEAFVARYPLDVRPDGAITAGADAHRALEVDRLRILNGGVTSREAVPMAIPPREYQRQAAALAYSSGGLLLGDELGLGKTVSAIALLAMEGALPGVVVVPAQVAIQWKREIEKFAPGLRVHIAKKGTPYEIKGGADVVILTYHKVYGWAGDLAGKARTIVFDECQELRTGAESCKYIGCQTIALVARYRLGLSATPIYNYGAEAWNILEILRPDALGSYEEFTREWCGYRSSVTEPAAFGKYLRDQGLFLRRTKREVGRELPPCEQVVHTVEMDSVKLREVESRATQLARIILAAANQRDRFTASSELSLQVRMATGIDKAPYAAAFVELLLEQGLGPVILVGWHRSVWDIWAERLEHHNPAWLTGSETPAQKQASVDSFVGGETDLLFLSLRSGAGLDGLQKRCSRIVFGELDWCPGVHEQCTGRVLRDGQTEPVFAYFLVGDGGSDPIMVNILGLKTCQVDGIRDPDAEILATQVDPDHVQRLARAYVERFGMGRDDVSARATEAFVQEAAERISPAGAA